MKYYVDDLDYLAHYGVVGQKWGVRNAEWYPIADWEAHLNNIGREAKAKIDQSTGTINKLSSRVSKNTERLKAHKKSGVGNTYGLTQSEADRLKNAYKRRENRLKTKISKDQDRINSEEENRKTVIEKALKDTDEVNKARSEHHDSVVKNGDLSYLAAHKSEFTNDEIQQIITRYQMNTRVDDLAKELQQKSTEQAAATSVSSKKIVEKSPSDVAKETAIAKGDSKYFEKHKAEFTNDEIKRFNDRKALLDGTKKQENQQKTANAKDTINKALSTAETVTNYVNRGTKIYNDLVPFINQFAGTNLKKLGAQSGDKVTQITETFKDGKLTNKTTQSTDEKGIKREVRENFSTNGKTKDNITEKSKTESVDKAENTSKSESKTSIETDYSWVKSQVAYSEAAKKSYDSLASSKTDPPVEFLSDYKGLTLGDLYKTRKK